MCQLDTEDVLGFPVTKADKTACVKTILDWIEDIESTRYFVCANPHSLQIAERDKQFRQALLNADLITPDGVGIVLASKILGGGIMDRVTGSDVFRGVSSVLNMKKKGRYFFLGSTSEVLDQIKSKMVVEYPGIKVVGSYSPPFKSEFNADDNQKIIESINQANPNVLWVGMTAPKQEKWIYENKKLLDVRFIAPVGAVFDFFTGRVKRSHPVFQRLGLEWLPRFLQEPMRLWKRNLISNPAFILRVMQEKFVANFRIM